MKNIFTLFVGTYGNEIFRYSFNIRTLEAVPDGSAKVENGSYLAAGSADTDPGNRPPSFIYALTESGSRSAVHALGNDIGMSRINTERSVGKDPCYVIHYQNHVITRVEAFPFSPPPRTGRCFLLSRQSGSQAKAYILSGSNLPISTP